MLAEPWTPDFPKLDIRLILVQFSNMPYDYSYPLLSKQYIHFDFILTLLNAFTITPLHLLYYNI